MLGWCKGGIQVTLLSKYKVIERRRLGWISGSPKYQLNKINLRHSVLEGTDRRCRPANSGTKSKTLLYVGREGIYSEVLIIIGNLRTSLSNLNDKDPLTMLKWISGIFKPGPCLGV